MLLIFPQYKSQYFELWESGGSLACQSVTAPPLLLLLLLPCTEQMACQASPRSQNPNGYISSQVQESVNYDRQENILAVNLASDIRLNRRDSIILQGNFTSSSNDGTGLQADVEGINLSLDSDDISSPLFQFLLAPEANQINYGASIAYQASFKRAYMKLGLGYSSIPSSWILQTIDFTWRFGGQTKSFVIR